MDNGISEYRVRMLKFDDNYCDKTRAVNEQREPQRKKSYAQGKNCEKVNDKRPQAPWAYKIVAGQTSYRTERKRSPDNQVNEKCLKQVLVHPTCPINQNKPRSTEYQFPTKRKQKRKKNVKAVNLDNIMWKFPEYGLSQKIRNPIRSFNSTNFGQQLRVMRKKGKENLHKRNKKKKFEVLFVRKPSEKNDRIDSKKPTSARPSWSFDDAFGFRSHRGRTSPYVYHQRAGIGRNKILSNKLSDLKPCKSCTNCVEDTPNILTMSEYSSERNSNQCKNFARNSLRRLSGKETFRSMEAPVKDRLDTSKMKTKPNIIDNTRIREHFDVGCGDGGLLQDIQTMGTNPEYAYDDTQLAHNEKLRRPRRHGRNRLSTLLGYILCGLIIIVWSPCIITFLLFWFITYPLRPEPVDGPWQIGDNKKGLGSTFRRRLNSEVWPITTLKKLCVIRSKSKTIFNHSLVPSPERKYLYHKSGKGSVIQPTPEIIIRDQPHTPDKRETHFLYKHNNINKIRRTKKWRNERTADFYSDTDLSTRQIETSRACHENFLLATSQHEQTVMRLDYTKGNEEIHSKKTVIFPHIFGKTTVCFKEPHPADNVSPPTSGVYINNVQNCNRPRVRRWYCPRKSYKYKKHPTSCTTSSPTRGHCVHGGFPSRNYLPLTHPYSRDSKMRRPCRKNQRSCLKHSSCTRGKEFRSHGDLICTTRDDEYLKPNMKVLLRGNRVASCLEKNSMDDHLFADSCEKEMKCKYNRELQKCTKHLSGACGKCTRSNEDLTCTTRDDELLMPDLRALSRDNRILTCLNKIPCGDEPTSSCAKCKKHSSGLCGKCSRSNKNSSPCANRSKWCLYKPKCGDKADRSCRMKRKRPCKGKSPCKHSTCRAVSFCMHPRANAECIRCHKPCQNPPCNCWDRLKTLFTGDYQTICRRDKLYRDLSTFRPHHVFFGPYNTESCCCEFFSSLWRIYRSLFRICLSVCTFIVWGPVFFTAYIIYHFLCFCM